MRACICAYVNVCGSWIGHDLMAFFLCFTLRVLLAHGRSLVHGQWQVPKFRKYGLRDGEHWFLLNCSSESYGFHACARVGLDGAWVDGWVSI